MKRVFNTNGDISTSTYDFNILCSESYVITVRINPGNTCIMSSAMQFFSKSYDDEMMHPAHTVKKLWDACAPSDRHFVNLRLGDFSVGQHPFHRGEPFPKQVAAEVVEPCAGQSQVEVDAYRLNKTQWIIQCDHLKWRRKECQLISQQKNAHESEGWMGGDHSWKKYNKLLTSIFRVSLLTLPTKDKESKEMGDFWPSYLRKVRLLQSKRVWRVWRVRASSSPPRLLALAASWCAHSPSRQCGRGCRSQSRPNGCRLLWSWPRTSRLRY